MWEWIIVFVRTLNVTFSGGVQFIDFYNDPNDRTGTSPYVRASLNLHLYSGKLASKSVSARARIATDIVAGTINAISLPKPTRVLLYGSIQSLPYFMPQLFGSLLGTFQNTSFNVRHSGRARPNSIFNWA